MSPSIHLVSSSVIFITIIMIIMVITSCSNYDYIIIGADALHLSSFFFGLGSGPIHMDEVRCVGTEIRLIDCTHEANHDCHHFEDAGVRCLQPRE